MCMYVCIYIYIYIYTCMYTHSVYACVNQVGGPLAVRLVDAEHRPDLVEVPVLGV